MEFEHECNVYLKPTQAEKLHNSLYSRNPEWPFFNHTWVQQCLESRLLLARLFHTSPAQDNTCRIGEVAPLKKSHPLLKNNFFAKISSPSSAILPSSV